MNRILNVLVGLKRNAAMSLASIVLIFLTLFLLGFALIITINTKNISETVLQTLEMHVYIDTEAKQKDIEEIVQSVKELNGVQTVELSNKEEQLNNVAKSLGEDYEVVTSYFGGDKNPLNDVLLISVTDENVDMNSLKVEIESINGVESASYGEEYGADELIETMNSIGKISIIVSIIFIFITMFLIINTIKLTINSRRKEIEIMRLVGATKGYITFPFAFEGALLGLVGGILAFVVVYFSYASIVGGPSSMLLSKMVPASHVLNGLILGQIVFGVFIGLVGSIIAIRNYLKI